MFVDDKLARVLSAGAYAFWNFQKNVAAEVIEERVQAMEVSGQELLTRDKVSLRVNLAASLRVTDPVAAQIVRAARELGYVGVHQAATGLRFLVRGLTEEQVSELARRLLANPTIHTLTPGEIAPSFPTEVASSGEVETLLLRGLSDSELLALSGSRRAALDLAEMKAVQAYFRSEGREPTDVEFEAT